MGKFDNRLTQLVDQPIITRLDGQGGVLALTSKELWFVSDDHEKSAPLVQIRRIAKADGGLIAVSGDSGHMIEIPLRTFQIDELKLFLESIKGHVAKAKTMAESSLHIPPPAPAPEPIRMPEPEPLRSEPAMSSRAAVAEPAPLKVAEPEPPLPEPEPYEPPLKDPSLLDTPRQEPPPFISAASTIEAKIRNTLWDRKEDPIPADDPLPSAAQVWEEEPLPPAPTPVPEAQEPVVSLQSLPTRSRTRSGMSLPLKLMSAVTAVFTIGYLVTHPSADFWLLFGLAVAGVGLAMTQWRLSELD
jgi:hypothetical protein